MNAKNIHNDSTNERKVVYHDPLCRFTILQPEFSDPELWEACSKHDPRRGVKIGDQCYRFLHNAAAVDHEIPVGLNTRL